jgi:hypothetical protein
MTAVSVTLQSGSSVSTTVTFGSFAGTISMGYVNPIVSDTGGSLQATNGTADISFVRVNVAATGTGTLTGVLYGFRNSSAAVNGGTPGAPPAGSAPQIDFTVDATHFGAGANVSEPANGDGSRKVRIGCNGVGTSVGIPAAVGANNAFEQFTCSFTDDVSYWDISGNGTNIVFLGSGGTLAAPTAIAGGAPVEVWTWYALDTGGNWDYAGEQILQPEDVGPNMVGVPSVYWVNVTSGLANGNIGGEFALHSNGNFCISASHQAYAALADTCALRPSASIWEFNNGTPGSLAQINVGVLNLGANVVNPFLQTKNTQTATAPGAGKADLRWLAGTNMGTCKLVSNAGTSATEVTIVDNVGGGC